MRLDQNLPIRLPRRRAAGSSGGAPRMALIRSERMRAARAARRRAFGQLSSVVLVVAAISVYVQFAPTTERCRRLPLPMSRPAQPASASG